MSLKVLAKSVVVGSFLSLVTMIAACASTNDPSNTEGTGSTESDLKCASTVSTKLATAGLKVDGKKSQHRCYAYVKSELRAAGMQTSPIDAAGYAESAYMFGVWAKKNPKDLAKMGLVPASNLDLDSLPKGAILVWARGQCGYSKVHGHIEIVVDDNSTKACSDFCQSFKKTCGKPDIYIPQGCATSSSPVAGPDPSTQPTEDDDGATTTPASTDVPLPVPRPADLGDDDDAGTSTDPSATDPTDPSTTTSGSGCFSQTEGATVNELACVDSDSDGVWEQCHNGKWYRGVSSDQSSGPYGACITDI